MGMRKRKELTTEEIFDVLKTHRDILAKYTVRKIGLFGSYARGDQREGSDVDFLVEFTKPTFDNFMDLLTALEKFLNRKVELITQGSLSPHIRPYVENEVKWYEV